VPIPTSIRLAVALACAIAASAQTAPRPIETRDVLAWKRIHSPVVSPDGVWFADRLTHNEGDSQIVLRNLKDTKETGYPIGESAPASPFGNQRSTGIAFSEDSRLFCLCGRSHSRPGSQSAQRQDTTLQQGDARRFGRRQDPKLRHDQVLRLLR